jgi:uncharacterized membrane protein YfcA
MATGFNEFAGYGGVAIAGLVTGYLAANFDPRMSLFIFGLTVIIVALIAAFALAKDTLPWARAEAPKHMTAAATPARAHAFPRMCRPIPRRCRY